MDYVLVVFTTGFAMGCIYALVALAFTIIYGACGLFNFAQGDIVMVGIAVAFLFLEVLRLPVPASIIAVPLGGIAVALILYYSIAEPLMKREAPFPAQVFGTVAVGMIVGAAVGIPTEYTMMRVPPFFGYTPWQLGPLRILPQHLIIILFTACIVFGYWFLLNKTMIGRAMQTISLDRGLAELLGVPASAMICLAFVISGAISGVAGFLIGPLVAPTALVGLGLMIKGFIAAIIGGLGNPYGAVVGGLLVGIIYSIVVGYVTPGHAEVVTFGILLVALLVKPRGILATKE